MKQKIVSLFPGIANKVWQRRQQRELNRILALKRFERFESGLLGVKTIGVDGPSFYFMFKEIISSKVYEFNSKTDAPLVIDGGANIGLSCYYFKSRFPKSRILAFEADHAVYDVLNENINNWELQGIEVRNEALWSRDESLSFQSEGADGGRVDTSSEGNHKVQGTRLSKYLKDRVEFLKLDIEGAEFEVIQECEDGLANVQNLFIEYHNFIERDQSLGEILGILKKTGFRYFLSSPGVTNRKPLTKINNYNGMDFQVNIHATRS